MDFFIDLARDARKAARADSTLKNPLKVQPEFVVRDSAVPIRIYLFDSTGAADTIDVGQTLAFAGKLVSAYTSDSSDNLFHTDTFTLNGTFYEGEVSLNTTEFIAAMVDNKTAAIKVEVELQGPSTDIKTIMQADAVGVKDVNRGDEGDPVDAGPTNATTGWVTDRIAENQSGEVHVITMDVTSTGQQLIYTVPTGFSLDPGEFAAVTRAVTTSNDPAELEVSLGTLADPTAYLSTFVVSTNVVNERHREDQNINRIPADTAIYVTVQVASNSTGHSVDFALAGALIADPA